MIRQLLLLTGVIAAAVNADTLTIAQAVELGLQNNFSIRIARNTTEKSFNNRKLKTGALLPTLRVDGDAAQTNTHYQPETAVFNSGSTPELRGSATLNWTLFDGFKMFHAGHLIDQQSDLNTLAARHEIEAAAVTIMTAYYQLIAQRSLLDAARQQLDISRAQLLFTEAQFEFARVGKRELLTQQVVVNTDSSQVLSRMLDARSALHTLNIALGRTPDTPVSPAMDSSVNTPGHDASWWFYEAVQHNTDLKMATVRKHIAVTQHAIARAALWPVLSAGGTLAATATQPVDNIRTRAELSLTFPLLTGFSRSTGIRNAAIDTQTADLTIQEMRLELQAHIYHQWEQLQISSEQVAFEQQTIDRAVQALELSDEQFKLGRITDLQLREAQQSLLNARVRYQSALFQNKVVALQLQQLAGKLNIPL
jgi:outer membrane protein